VLDGNRRFAVEARPSRTSHSFPSTKSPEGTCRFVASTAGEDDFDALDRAVDAWRALQFTVMQNTSRAAPGSDGRTVAKRRTDEQRKAEILSKNMRGPNDEEPSRTGILGAWEGADIWTKRILIAIPALIVIFIVSDSAVAVVFWLLMFGLFVGVAWYIVQRRGRGGTGESRDS
jgi:hypothetical protein